MKILRDMFNDIRSSIGAQEYNESVSYVPSQYIYAEPVDDGIVYYNSLSKAIVLLNDASEFIPTEELVRRWFFFPEGTDQYKFCCDVKDKLFIPREMEDKPNSFVVFTTMACNARCPYCYERNYDHKVPMSDKVALDSAKWMAEKATGGFSVEFFGGEPTTNPRAIDIITDYLRENSRYNWHSTMISNGYLLDEIGVEKLRDKWRITSIQITLDGVYDDYNSVKSFIYKDTDAFKKVINNIELMIHNNIFITIRLNVTMENKEKLSKIVKYLNDRFYKDNDMISLYSYPIYKNENETPWTEEEKNQLYQNFIDIENEIALTCFSRRNVDTTNWDALKIYNCMGDRGNCYCITPVGNLTVCEHHVNDEIVGSIYSEERDTEVENRFTVRRDDYENCKTCPFKPNCSYITMCMGVPLCNDKLIEYRDQMVRRGIRKWYAVYKEDNAPQPVDGANICYVDVQPTPNAIYLPESIPPEARQQMKEGE